MATGWVGAAATEGVSGVAPAACVRDRSALVLIWSAALIVGTSLSFSDGHVRAGLSISVDQYIRES
jgi:hypothetical protein